MNFQTDDSCEDLRYKVGAAIELDRELDFSIHGSAARVAIESVQLSRDNDSRSRMLVKFVMPNEFRLESLEIPEDSSEKPFANTYSTEPTV